MTELNSDRTAADVHRQLARRARLKYQLDTIPGIQRRRAGKGFHYHPVNGKSLAPDEHDRIRMLGIPPAWRKVWISPLENGHLQATGLDARRRKQYRYHARWTEIVNRAKFDRLLRIGEALPRLRRIVKRDLTETQLTKRLVTAVVVRLLDLTAARVGSVEYLKDNDSHGLTTLLDRQVQVIGATIEFRFRGKSGIRHEFSIIDAKLARLIERCKRIPGLFVFQYRGDAGYQPITAEDVNAYLAEATNGLMTAKDFRTWRGSTAVAACLMKAECPAGAASLKRTLMQAFRETAAVLGNTVTVCRKYYVHCGLTETYLAGTFARITHRFQAGRPRGLSRDEQLLMHFLVRLK